MAKCSTSSCNNSTFSNREECALHCTKSDYSIDRHETELLNAFYHELLEVIVQEVLSYAKESINETDLRVQLSVQTVSTVYPILAKQLSEMEICLENIWFPDHDSRDMFDYTRILELFRGLHFKDCNFSTSGLYLKQTTVFFDGCRFRDNWHLRDYAILENVNDVTYQLCVFEKGVSMGFEANEAPVIENNVFYDCVFKKRILLENTNFKGIVFASYNTRSHPDESKFSLEVCNCEFEKEFTVSQKKLDTVLLESTVFKSETRLAGCEVNRFDIRNCKFEKMALVTDSDFAHFKISNSEFQNITSFEGNKFGTELASNLTSSLEFVIFLGFVSFSGSRFFQGLSLKRVSMKETPHFLGVDINHEQTDRETYRIIKNSFDKVGNYIEGNRFYKFEMLKRGEELSKNNRSWERFVYALYKYSSDFGQSIGRPLFWIAISAVIYSGLLHAKNEDWLYKIIPGHVGDIVSQTIGFVNQLTKGIIPFKRWFEPGMEFLSLIFYIIFTSLIWLVILAIKRHTKR